MVVRIRVYNKRAIDNIITEVRGMDDTLWKKRYGDGKTIGKRSEMSEMANRNVEVRIKEVQYGIRTKVILHFSTVALERDINKFLSTISENNFIDIKVLPNTGIIIIYREELEDGNS